MELQLQEPEEALRTRSNKYNQDIMPLLQDHLYRNNQARVLANLILVEPEPVLTVDQQQVIWRRLKGSSPLAEQLREDMALEVGD